MPRSLRPAAYPSEYEEFLLAAARNKGHVITLADPAFAYRLRIRMYCYFRALRETDSVRARQLAHCADMFMLVVNGCDLAFTVRSDNWDAVALRDALNLPPPAMPQAPDNSNSLLSKLSLIRARDRKEFK